MAELNVIKNVKLNDLTYVVMQDERLSWTAKGIYAYMQCQVEGPTHSFSVEDIINSNSDDQITILDGIAELIQCHYLQAKIRNYSDYINL